MHIDENLFQIYCETNRAIIFQLLACPRVAMPIARQIGLPKTSGVYALFDAIQCVYIGKTINLSGRMNNHCATINSSILDLEDFTFVTMSLPMEVAVSVEERAISDDQPLWNKLGFGTKQNQGCNRTSENKWWKKYGRPGTPFDPNQWFEDLV